MSKKLLLTSALLLPVLPANADDRRYQSNFALGAWRCFVAGDGRLRKRALRPYDVQITDVDPGDNIFHHEAIVAGVYTEIGYEREVGGVAPSQCTPVNNVISFTFANYYYDNPIAICHTVGQETAHSYGLEHAFDCSDPMTYLQTCGRQFFRDATTPCGEYTALEQCNCGGSAQNSHRWLRTVLGESPAMLAGPALEITSPAEGDSLTSGFYVQAIATHIRGIGTVELFLNGTSYGTLEAHEDRTEFLYRFDAPADLADGIIDIEIRATNDIGVESVAKLSAQKGAPCTDKASCHDGQSCSEGRCSFPPSSGLLGDAALMSLLA